MLTDSLRRAKTQRLLDFQEHLELAILGLHGRLNRDSKLHGGAAGHVRQS